MCRNFSLFKRFDFPGKMGKKGVCVVWVQVIVLARIKVFLVVVLNKSSV